MFQIIYLSSAAKLFSSDQLKELLEHTRHKNQACDLTGMLLYRDGNFIQVLEGKETEVREVFGKICQDPRHRGIITVVQEEIPNREFPDWSMGFRDLSMAQGDELEGYSTIMNTLWKDETHNREHLTKCRRMLATFRRTLR